MLIIIYSARVTLKRRMIERAGEKEVPRYTEHPLIIIHSVQPSTGDIDLETVHQEVGEREVFWSDRKSRVSVPRRSCRHTNAK